MVRFDSETSLHGASIRGPRGQNGPLLVRRQIAVIDDVHGMTECGGWMQQLSHLQVRCSSAYPRASAEAVRKCLLQKSFHGTPALRSIDARYTPVQGPTDALQAACGSGQYWRDGARRRSRFPSIMITPSGFRQPWHVRWIATDKVCRPGDSEGRRPVRTKPRGSRRSIRASSVRQASAAMGRTLLHDASDAQDARIARFSAVVRAVWHTTSFGCSKAVPG